jgi:hypothetical protein
MPRTATYVEATLTDTSGVLTEVVSDPVYNSLATAGKIRANLQNGNSTIAVPTNTRGVIITVSNGTTVKTLKGAAGDTGIRIFSAGSPRNNGSFLLLFDMTVASFVINSAGADTGITEIQFV